MSEESEPVHLSNHHRTTLGKIFQHPVSHNLEWHDALSLMEAVATVEEKHDGKYEITLGEDTQSFDRPKHKDLDAQEVLDLRRMLSDFGFSAPQ
jgi:hypothetical protein